MDAKQLSGVEAVQGPMRRTHDGRLVHVRGSALPERASGWTLCSDVGGAYSMWVAPLEQDKARAKYRELEASISKLPNLSLCLGVAAQAGLGQEFVSKMHGKLKDAKRLLLCLLVEQAWPLIEADL
jgi:hypothetical protein